jgi:hypothetical protein
VWAIRLTYRRRRFVVKVVERVAIQVKEDAISEAEDGEVTVSPTVRQVASAMATYRKSGTLGAVLAQLANSNMTPYVAKEVVDYMWETNEHPTLVQGVLDICWCILLEAGKRLEDYHPDARLRAGKELTTKLVEMVEEYELPHSLPCV